MSASETSSRSEDGATRHAARTSSGPRSARILVVDDNEDCRKALRAFLEASGYEVHEASDGEEAVSRAGSVRPDLILIDLMMPGVDGLEATRRIRELPGLGDVRIVAISAMEGAHEVSQSVGVDACVVKPLDMREFPRRVDGWLRGD